MNITKDTVVTLRYSVSDAAGKLLEEAKEPMAYLHGGYDNTLPKIEAALDGQNKGFTTSLLLQPEDAFGNHDANLVQTIPKREFPPGVKIGGQLKRRGVDGQEQVFTVMKIKGDSVHLDGNHPWAGQVLRFQISVTEVRMAIAEEIEHKHVHGTGGHPH